ncbi:hypothetical protein GUA36_14830 [Vibrio parahaemolyticus]|nr:hypothetical protein [Vibrio parahaemolyticus]EGQ8290361.1 hypothetical protein [Vibrio parahaemolyticus]EGQ8328584.1 hypothetical protein [Vibrio parahaemolyticus]EGQ8330852.1 hypothetical protein [Vibrio parahaemolyticus]EGQ8351541.1 hypothetical protein [Vibrio parahaemolyticus]
MPFQRVVMLEERLYEHYLPGYLESNSEEEKQRLWQQADPNTIYQLNSDLQKLHGEGNDLISFSDPHRSHLPITAWPDMLSADIAFWRKHQHWLLQSNDPVTPTNEDDLSVNYKIPLNYINQYNGEHLRLFYGSRLVYARLFSALHYILNHVKSVIEDWSHDRYPYQLPIELYIPTTSEPQSAVRSTYHHFNSANYQSLKNYFQQHYSSWIEEQYLNWMFELNTQLNHQTAATYIVEYEDEFGIPRVDFICKNENTLRMIRPAHFVEDMRQMVSSTDYLDHQVQQVALRIERQCRAKGW